MAARTNTWGRLAGACAIALSVAAIPSTACAAGVATSSSVFPPPPSPPLVPAVTSFVAGAGEINVLDVTHLGYSIFFGDSTSTITSEGACNNVAANPNLVQCGILAAPTVALGSQADSYSGFGVGGSFGEFALTVNGGSGADQLHGGDYDEFLDGGEGLDLVEGGDGDDTLLGGDSDGDTVDGQGGDDDIKFGFDGAADVLRGGAGIDRLVAPAVGPPSVLTVDLAAGTAATTFSGTTETDSVAGIEDYEGAIAKDVVKGSVGPNLIRTGYGDDEADGGGGPDRIRTEAGADNVIADDGVADDVDCGAGSDTAVVDQFDVVAGCEALTVRTVAPPVTPKDPGTVQPTPDTRAPRCTLSGLKKTYTAASAVRGLALKVTCDEATSLAGTLASPVKRRRGKLVAARAGDLVLTEASVRAGTGARTLKLKANRRLVRALGKRFRLRLRIEATDGAGNRATITRSAKVKPPRKKRRR